MAGGIVKEHVMSGGIGGVQLKGSIELVRSRRRRTVW